MRTVNPERHAARRAAILDAAAEVFAERGYDGTTTAAICKRAGVGSGTLFHYFADKRSMFVGIVGDDLTAAVEAVGRVDPTSPVAALGQVLDLLIADFGDPRAPGLAVAMMQLAGRDEKFAGLVVAKDEVVRRTVADLLTRAQEDGLADATIQPTRAARWLVGLTDAGYLMSDDPDFDSVVEAQEVRRILTAYLGLEPGALDTVDGTGA